VGTHYLTEARLDTLLRGVESVADTSKARRQVIEQWVTRTLLYREALRLNLHEVPKVKRRLEQRRRSTLVSSMTDRIYEQAELRPSEEEVRTYFERHRDQLQLREPYVEVRYLSTRTADDAAAVQETLRKPTALADSTWSRLLDTHALAPRRARRVSGRILPERRVFGQLPLVQGQVERLQEGEVSTVVDNQNRHHILQLVRRVPEGTDPQLKWLEDEIRRRLRIRTRKQMYAREVQRLRNQAEAENEIEVQ
jgi:parvulin-like peptidyl-prolyl isomerase